MLTFRFWISILQSFVFECSIAKHSQNIQALHRFFPDHCNRNSVTLVVLEEDFHFILFVTPNRGCPGRFDSKKCLNLENDRQQSCASAVTIIERAVGLKEDFQGSSASTAMREPLSSKEDH